jgi:hypothetical protein
MDTPHGCRLAREFADPIYFPGFAAVGGVGLLHARRVGREVEPEVAHEDGAGFEVFLMEKLAAGAGELADHGIPNPAFNSC